RRFCGAAPELSLPIHGADRAVARDERASGHDVSGCAFLHAARKCRHVASRVLRHVLSQVGEYECHGRAVRTLWRLHEFGWIATGERGEWRLAVGGVDDG